MARSDAMDFLWDTIFLKVEDKVFRRPRYAFVQHSPVFEDMYLVGDASTGEGKSVENPIVLEGYKSDDFEALLMVLYPTTNDIIVGKLDLTREQWVGVLRLSRPWEMSRIRRLAIETLSSNAFSLTSADKVTLARDHKVATWLVEGLTSLTLGDPPLSPDDLEAAVGLRTAFRISSIQVGSRGLAKSLVSCYPWQGSSSVPAFAIEAFRCGSCLAACFPSSFSCHSCNRTFEPDDPSSTRLLGSGYALINRPKEVHIAVNVQYLYCGSCSNRIVTRNGRRCLACNWAINTNNQIFASISPCLHPASTSTTEGKVREVFKDEIDEYEA